MSRPYLYALCPAGTAVYTLGDTTSSGAARETLGGDLLVLVSAVLYAAYTVSIRKSLTDDDHVRAARCAAPLLHSAAMSRRQGPARVQGVEARG